MQQERVVTTTASNKIGRRMLQLKQAADDGSSNDHPNFDTPIPAKVGCRFVRSFHWRISWHVWKRGRIYGYGGWGGLATLINIISWRTVQLCAHLKIGQIHGGGGGTCHSLPRWIVHKPSTSGITYGVRMTPACFVGTLSCTWQWYGPKPLTTMVAWDTELVLRQGWILWPTKYPRSMVHFYVSSKQLQPPSQEDTGLGNKGGGNTEGAPKKRFWHDSIFSCNRRLRKSFSVWALK